VSKTHYRKVFKSDHLGVADLEDLAEAGSNLVFTISHVRQEFGAKVAGKKGDFNIAYFKEKIKPLVLNATNSKVLKERTGSAFVEDWGGIIIQLYIDPSAKFGTETVGGVRINPHYKGQSKKELAPENTTAWNNAIQAYKRDGNLEKVEARMSISDENKLLLIEAANAVA
jgi:hypothetical protein